MEGIIFYWLFWLFWILSTFFMRKDERRLKISLWLLLAIICSIHSIFLFQLEISITTLFMLLSTYIMVAKQKKGEKVYLFITSFIVMLAYTTFHLFELIDPVWLVIDRKWMLSLLLFYLVVNQHKSMRMRILSLLSGSIHGEILFSIILRRYSNHYFVGGFEFLDCLAISFAFLLGLEGLKKLSVFFEQHVHQFERERRKLL